MDKLKDQLQELQQRLDLVSQKLNPDEMKIQARELEAQTMKPGFGIILNKPKASCNGYLNSKKTLPS